MPVKDIIYYFIMAGKSDFNFLKNKSVIMPVAIAWCTKEMYMTQEAYF